LVKDKNKISKMDIQKIEKRLKRINTVLEAFKEDNKISKIEKDLLLGYMRELYELIRDSDADISELPKPSKAEAVVESPKEVIKEVIVEKVIEVEKPIVEVEKPSTQAPKSEPVVKVEPQEQKVESAPPKATVSSKISPELEAIFVKEEITDLADKLSMMKINDIAQAIGINSRLVMINELFNGDGNLFNATIKKLNGCSSFEEAKSLLINEVALPLDWEKEDKLKEAQQLVKLVMRKFS
jgi:hypothetical protein